MSEFEYQVLLTNGKVEKDRIKAALATQARDELEARDDVIQVLYLVPVASNEDC